MKILTVLLVFLAMLGCRQETLEIQPAPDTGIYPEFNFNIENTSTIESVPIGGKVTYNLYIRQQLMHVPGRRYFVSFKLPQQHDGEAIIHGQPWRSGDWVPVDYDKAVANNYRIPFTYMPSAFKAASYAMVFTCLDEKGKSMSFTKEIIIE